MVALLLACVASEGETTCPVDVGLAEADLPCLCAGVEVAELGECEDVSCEDGEVVREVGECEETGW